MLDNIIPSEVLNTLLSYFNQYFSALNTTQISLTLRENLNFVATKSDVIVLLIIFFLAYILWSISRALFSWVWGMFKFAFWVTLLIGLYWLWVSIDVERGNEELRLTTKKVVSGVKGVVREAVIHNEL
ncbi:hypothetical protein G9A89_023808 [Geosiphon pyriformis]|nr:hypothetical protein G9A89_023808 [Geosiphon pyriformis]